MELKTPLYDMHVKYKGKIVPFAGYLLPVQYEKGVIAEHMAVREQCGLFDVSHMGEILLSGPDALKNVNMLLTNDYTVMEDGTARYSPMCNEAGGVVDDLIVYKIKDNSYFIVVNASNKDKDYQWMKDHVSGDVELKDISGQVGQLALQGPKALDVLKKVADPDAIPDKYYTFKKDCCIDGIPCIISKTGYTGEDGVEIYMAGNDAPRLWELLLEAGREEGLIPCGLGARDTLRLEASMPLYGHEMDDTITPKEAGLGIFVKMDKEDFIGKKAACEVDDRVDLVFGEQGAHGGDVARVGLDEGDFFAADFLHGEEDGRIAVVEVVHAQGLVALLDELHKHVRAEIAGSAGDENLTHIVFLLTPGLSGLNLSCCLIQPGDPRKSRR